MAEPSSVAISNSALLMIGDSTITSLDDATNRAKVCNHFYDEIRDATIRAFPWNFATRYMDFGAVLTSEVPVSGFGYTNAFALPTSPYVLRVLRPIDVETQWQVVGRYLYTDESTFKAKCLVRVTDEAQFDALFREAFAAHLAATIAWPLTKNRALMGDMMSIYQQRLGEAQEIDSHEGLADDLESEALLDVRWG